MVKEYDIGIRLQALTLYQQRMPRHQILEKTGYSTSGLTCLVRKAKQRGFTHDGPILLEYVANEPGKGRKTKLTEEHARRLVAILTSDAASSKFSGQRIADIFNEQDEIKEAGITISASTARSSLATQGYKLTTEPKTKPGYRIIKKPSSKEPTKSAKPAKVVKGR